MAALALTYSGIEPSEAEPSEQKPNILIFYVDDLGLGDLRVYDATSTIPTPNIERLAADGLKFTHAHSASAVCTPSRYSLLTGRHEFRSQLDEEVLRSAYAAPLLEQQVDNIAKLLRRGGYSTSLFGKWHLGMSWSNLRGDGVARAAVNTSQYSTTDVDFRRPIIDGPLNHGFDRFFGIGSTLNQGPYTFIDGDRVTKVPRHIRSELTVGDGRFREDWVAEGWDSTLVNTTVAEQALAFIEGHVVTAQGKPFFMIYASTSNHWPHTPPGEVFGRPVKGRGGSDDGKPDRNDMILENDIVLGVLLDKLDDPNGDGDRRDSIAKNTLVILTSDNGADVGSFGNQRGLKDSVYEGGHRVPMIVRWPNQISARGASHALINQVDFYRSLAVITGIAPDGTAGEDSLDLSRVLTGVDRKVGRDRMLISRNGRSEEFSLREGKWKLIIVKERPTALYDLSDDPGEIRNLLVSNRDIAERLYILYRRDRGIDFTHQPPTDLWTDVSKTTFIPSTREPTLVGNH